MSGVMAVHLTGEPGDDAVDRPILLVADPDEDLAALAEHGIAVIRSTDGPDALLRIGSASPDVLLVSARLPGIDAATFIQALRRRALTMPIILGAGPDDADVVMRALAAGATACVAKPYRMQELLPLLHTTRSETSPPPLRVGDIELDPIAHVVRVAGVPVHVPLREFELLHFLMANTGRVVTRLEIARHVWHSDVAPLHNTIAVHVKRLRNRVGDDQKNPAIICTVRGVGYRITAPAGC